ncbi:MAG: acylphosphatase [Candidatus Daviesbacteria bacterium]|nr:acylphosphatase [Candidatus Daviesbacteria bacterium]
MVKHLNIIITGRVQGVFFRHFSEREAQKLDIKGLVKNLPDGSLYIEAEGEKENLDKFTKWCKKGPKFAKIEQIKTSETPIKNYNKFSII